MRSFGLSAIEGIPPTAVMGLSRRVRELVGEDGHAIVEFMLDVMNDESARKADRIEAAKWLGDRGFGKAPLALDVGVSEQAFLSFFQGFSTEDLETMRAMYMKYSPDVAELAESGELRLGAAHRFTS